MQIGILQKWKLLVNLSSLFLHNNPFKQQSLSFLMNPQEYYSQKHIQQELLRQAQDKECQAWFKDVRGRRPEVVYQPGDIYDLVRQGMTSFHISEEQWHDPLVLKPGMQKRELDNLRKGWNLILDLDSKELSFSFITGELLVEALKFHNIKHYSLKYSGNHGLHIGIPFEAFPKEVNGIPIKDYFPDGVRIIASYLKDMIKEHLTARLLEKSTIDEACAKAQKTREEALKDGIFNPFSLVDIDSVLVSSRHLYRAAYSINEKSGLVSIPLKNIQDFDKEQAKPENVKVKLKFLDREETVKGEARRLLMQAFDWAVKKQTFLPQEGPVPRVYSLPSTAIQEKHFPPCIKLLLDGIEDGKKRAVFVFINFLTNLGWNLDQIEAYLNDWNKKNKEPLREGYVSSQINWHKRQQKNVLPANCDNPAYYPALNVCRPDEMCKMIKNPVNYSLRKSRLEEYTNKIKRGKKKEKTKT